MSSPGAQRAAARGSATGGVMENRGGAANGGGGGAAQKQHAGARSSPQQSGATPTAGAKMPAVNNVGKPVDAQPDMKADPHTGSVGAAGGPTAMDQGQMNNSGNNAGAANPYANPMYVGGVSGYGSMVDNYSGGVHGNAAGTGNMNGTHGYGSMYDMGGAGMGSMYGMGVPMESVYGMCGPMGSMYGMGGPMGSIYGMGMPMGSMYGMGMPMGSMYGMGMPMGSMYGMGMPMGSMYGMGGPMGSMYGMGGGLGSMMARSMSFSSYGGGSLYGSMGGGSSIMSLGGSTRNVSGMWGTEYGYKVRSRRDRDMPTMAKMLKDDEVVEKRHLVTATQKMLEKEAKGEAGKSSKNAEDKGNEESKKEDAAAGHRAGKKNAAKRETETKDSKAKTVTDGDGEEKDKKRTLVEKKDEAQSGVSHSAVRGPVDTNAIHSVVIVEDAKSDRVKIEKAEAGHKVVIIQGVAGKPVEFKATDVLSGPVTDASQSTVLSMMAAHVNSGHNVCLIAIDTKEKMTPLFVNVIVTFFTESLGRLGAEDKWKITFSATAINGPNKYRDLAKEDGAEPADIVFGSNPIFGPCIMDAKQVDLKETSAVEKHAKEALVKVGTQEMLFLQAVLYIRKGKDLFLSSINAFVLRSTDTAEAAAILDDRRVPVPLLRTAIGGATRTAVVVSVTGAESEAASEGDVLRVAASIAAKENASPRSGNVPRFIEYTEEQIAKIEKDKANLSGEAKERRMHMVEKMRTMASDAKELIATPEAQAKVYPINTKGAASPATKKDGNAVAGAREVPVGGQQPSAAAAASAAPNGGAASPVVPFSSIHRLVYMCEAKKASVNKAVEVTIGDETKAYDVDECIECPAGAAQSQRLQESKELERMSGILSSGCNVAMLGAEHLAPTQPTEQVTWRYVKCLLTAVLTPQTPEMTSEVLLHMSVLHERDVVADLISGSTEQRRLIVATSPLFGPMVYESATAKVRDPQEMLTVVDKALTQAASCLSKEGSLIVMTAALKQVLKDDVRVASLFAVSAADMSPYKCIIERSPKYSCSLFTYALGGPASTALLISASHSMDQLVLATSLSTQRSVSHIKVPAPRNGSVKEFVQYARDSIDRQKKRMATLTDTAEKEQSANSIRRLEDSLKDHEELLANPSTVEARAYPPEVTGQLNAQSPTENRNAEALSPGQQANEPQPSVAAAIPAQTPQTHACAASRQALHVVKVQPREEPEEPAEQQPQLQPQNATATVEAEKASSEKQSTNQVQFLAVITQETRPGLPTKEGWSVGGAGKELVVTDVEGSHSFEVDEVVTRVNRNSPIVSTMLEDLRTKFLEGQNVALITADTRGSAASLEAVDRSVRGILGKLTQNSSLHMSFSALKEQSGTVLDTLNDEDNYKPIEVTTSPLFGPIVAGASFRKISTVEDFVRLMSTGLRKCGEGRACVVLQLLKVETKPEESDVCVNSFLGVMCPGDISVYRHALDMPVKERGVFSLALGGSCHTVFVAGLTKSPADEGCLLLPRLAQALKASVHNVKPRGNSMKHFIEHTKGAAAQLQRNIDRATSEEEKTKMQRYLQTVQNMVETSEAYVADPGDKIPPTYPLGNHADRREM